MSDLAEWNAAIVALRQVLSHMGESVPVSRDDPTATMLETVTGQRFVPTPRRADDVRAIQKVIGILSDDLSRWHERDAFLREKHGA